MGGFGHGSTLSVGLGRRTFENLTLSQRHNHLIRAASLDPDEGAAHPTGLAKLRPQGLVRKG